MARALRKQAQRRSGLGALGYAGLRVAGRQSPCGADPTVWMGRPYDGGEVTLMQGWKLGSPTTVHTTYLLLAYTCQQ